MQLSGCRSRSQVETGISLGPLWSAHLDGQRGTFGFPMCRRASLALTACLGACLAVDRAHLKRLLWAWGSPSRSDENASVSSTSASSARKASSAASPANPLELSWTVVAPLYSANLRSASSTSSSPSTPRTLVRARCRAPLSEEQWRSLNDLSEEWVEHVRRDWGCQFLKSVFSDTRAAAAWDALSLPWKPFFWFAFKVHRHINRLEIESAPSLLRHLAAEGHRNCRVPAITDSRVALGALSKGRSSSRRCTTSSRKPLLSVSVTASSLMSCGSQRGATLQTRLPEDSLSPPGAPHCRERAHPAHRTSPRRFMLVSASQLSAGVFFSSMPAIGRLTSPRCLFSLAGASLCPASPELPSVHC